ncbi:MAG TPA: winged helix-turn-helix domain-containing protein [Solirubrobacterales bacterium]|nr:winged helix-turn-helix domain-containing protein [Solirubrobacterales bacterium]
MARALADPWRVRILIEVTVRPLSPSQFVDRFGGELTHVARCFRQLAQWGYLEVAEERPGRRRGAAIEHIYRAMRRAHFDTYTWEGVSYSGRDSISRSVLASYQQRIGEALDAGTFDQEVDRHLSWDAIVLDRPAWRELGERLDLVLGSLEHHEIEAGKRLGASGEPIPATVGMAAFRSPGPPTPKHGTYGGSGPGAPGQAQYVLGPKLAKALANRWRCRILMEVSIRPQSPSQFVEEFGGSMTHVSRCFRELAKWGYIEILEERRGGRRGGGVERIYKSTHSPYFASPTWKTLPQIIREEMSPWFLNTYFDRIAEAIEQGTFDAEVDRHLSWKAIVIDREAWTTICADLDEILVWLPELEAQSLERTADPGELIPTTVGMASFRSPSSRRPRSDV